MDKVYLSGGMRSDWQDRVMEAEPNAEYFDPRSHGLKNPFDYVAWDMRHVGMSTIVFAYVEAENPTALGLAAEVAAGSVEGKLIILVDEKSATDEKFARYFTFIRVLAHEVYDNLEDGIVSLKMNVKLGEMMPL